MPAFTVDSVPNLGINPGIPGLAFLNPEIPGLENGPGIAIPSHNRQESLANAEVSACMN